MFGIFIVQKYLRSLQYLLYATESYLEIQVSIYLFQRITQYSVLTILVQRLREH
jgi:hypothetical protein